MMSKSSTCFCTFVKKVSTFSFLAASTSCRILVAQFSCSVVSDSFRPHGLHAACQASLSIPNSWSLLKLMSIQSVMPSNHLTLCRPLLLPSIVPSTRVFSDESVLRIRWPKYWSCSICINPSNEYSRLISFRIDWLISLLSKGLSRVFHNSKQLFSTKCQQHLGCETLDPKCGALDPGLNSAVNMLSDKEAFNLSGLLFSYL